MDQVLATPLKTVSASRISPVARSTRITVAESVVSPGAKKLPVSSQRMQLIPSPSFTTADAEVVGGAKEK